MGAEKWAESDEFVDLTDDGPSHASMTQESQRSEIMNFAANINKENVLLQSSLQRMRKVGDKRRHECTESLLCEQVEHVTLISDDEDQVSIRKGEHLGEHLQKRQRRILERSEVNAVGAEAEQRSSSEILQDKPSTINAENTTSEPPMNHELKALALLRESRKPRPAGPITESISGVSSSAGTHALQLHHIKRDPEEIPSLEAHPISPDGPSLQISILSYNVWFKEEVALEGRMQGLSQVIQDCGIPDFLLLQEVTHNMVKLWSCKPWWNLYSPSPVMQQRYFTMLLTKKETVSQSAPAAHMIYANSVMARSLQYVKASVHGVPIIVSTTHLESPTPPTHFYSKERVTQKQEAVGMLDTLAKTGGMDAVLAGDLNWAEERDGPLSLPHGWQDAWAVTSHPKGETGLTYDTHANPMLYKGGWRGGRLDRALCKLGNSFEVGSIELVGKTALPGVVYVGPRGRPSPVLPSDHFGLLMKLNVKPEVLRPGRMKRDGSLVQPLHHRLLSPAATGQGSTRRVSSTVTGILMPFTGVGRTLGAGGH
ncbi:hypothetical protein CEUSTIGMA_g1154.t1 [Chlamydomonas eustigma]|uniref:Endonuclease/exonuclease/phosphatase domain-containing protein n=1 Tax=Chlamydomonas eustigma TaxID=1157962 RepID=A0A250WSR9_9CHLO|nr:hypothetical protein CEUSTIGMA_g1154.t1 [Chlamydomonas eustigma]|eukprot:GAX73702.1 hypothetical protein CEUSTIGMA_g1154.t1 [Chlamydomonas eustigma]